MKLSNYSKEIILKSNEISREILQMICDNKEIFINDILEPTEEESVKKEEQITVLANDIVKMMAEKGVKANFASRSVENIIEGFTGLKAFVDGTLRNWEDEYVSRSFGIKNSEGKFRREEITISDLLVKLNEIRESTGNNMYDFYNDSSKEQVKEDHVDEAQVAEEVKQDIESPYTE